MPRFSVIVPVYNRIDEVSELLERTRSHTRREKPMLNVRGVNFSSCTLPPRMPPVVIKEVMAKCWRVWLPRPAATLRC